ncbi:MAG: TlpA family protein disulfide reductase [Gammaproteobacteria bacterium]|jgi:thiol-disulfide isomerase/thioredoxin|nr:TlpA family protein disulfide reductase [Gammaproteobacteria bacterium]MCH1551399.1 TlpA family protein disulfide reductase [Pseudomonadales bacterium]
MRFLISGIVLLLVCGCVAEEKVPLADGTAVPLSQWEGRWLVINYWAEWCGPCRDEIPELNELHAERAATGMVVLGVNYDGLVQPKLGEVIGRMDIKFPTLLKDPEPTYGYGRPEQLPVTVLINPAREVHRVLIGPQTASALLAAAAP